MGYSPWGCRESDITEQLTVSLYFFKVKWGHLGSIGLVSLWEEEEITGMHMNRGQAMWEHTKKAAICKPRREASEDMKPASTWVLHFQPAEQWE